MRERQTLFQLDLDKIIRGTKRNEISLYNILIQWEKYKEKLVYAQAHNTCNTYASLLRLMLYNKLH